MNPLRKKKLESAILRDIAELIIKRQRKDDRFGLISVSSVELRADFSELLVRVSLFGDKQDAGDSWRALQDHAVYFQSTLARDLRLRQTPHLIFIRDESISEGDRINALLQAGDDGASRPDSAVT
ncbi:MAG: 30S ribosome-binding factor RbfA [Leptospiraceae bacterium]|nr:30S ribosome-binding factor RbfA [Leptospiraceae bacterium]